MIVTRFNVKWPAGITATAPVVITPNGANLVVSLDLDAVLTRENLTAALIDLIQSLPTEADLGDLGPGELYSNAGGLFVTPEE